MTPAEITARLAHCAHIWETADHGPRPTWDPSQEWADHKAELRRDDERYELAVLTDHHETSRP